MGNTDSVPVVSQVKSLVQFIGGDSAAALTTQENFAYRNTFPVISQIASAGYAIGGDMDKARDLQEKFAEDMQRVIDSIPVAGHVKGGVHYALGENDKGDVAMKAASRSTGVVIGGVGGFAVGGPVGAVAGGIAGGAAADGIITGSEFLVHGPTARPYGYAAHGEHIVEVIQGKKNMSIAEGFDIAMTPVGDGLGGFGAGKMIGKPLGLGKPGGKVGGIPYVPLRGAIVKASDKAAGAGMATVGEGVVAKVKVGASTVDDNMNSFATRSALEKKILENRGNQLNPNHEVSGPGRPAGYKGTATKLDLDNHANQMNPNNPLFLENLPQQNVVLDVV